MSVASVVLRGYGNGTVTGTIPLVVTRGYDIGAAAPVTTPVAPTPFAGGGGARHFTPIAISGRKRKRIDQVIAAEARVRNQIEDYQANGADLAILSDLLEKLRELQITLLRLALESEEAQTYIGLKRMQEEDEDVLFIARYL